MKSFLSLLVCSVAFASVAGAGEISCRVQGYARGPLSAAWTDWRAVEVTSLDACVAEAQKLVGREFDMDYYRMHIVAGKFDYRDGSRRVSGEVRAPGRSGD